RSSGWRRWQRAWSRGTGGRRTGSTPFGRPSSRRSTAAPWPARPSWATRRLCAPRGPTTAPAPPKNPPLAGGREGGRTRLSGDPLCHSLVFVAAEECVRLGVPLQVHCGLGDMDADLAESSPLGIRTLLTHPRFADLRIVLLHCYPFHREAAYLCSVHPGVF